nr:DUF2793 domain-containing protein [Polymorphobacter sp.]
MNESVRHRLPMLAAGQAQKEVTHNEAVMAVDRLLHPAVLSRGLSVPPALASPGDCYIVASPGGGGWTGFAGQLASHDGFGWTFTNPVRGCLVWIADEASFSVFDGVWSSGGFPVTGLRIGGRQVLGAPPTSIANAVGGTMIDVEVRAMLGFLISALRDQGIVV